MMHDGKCDMLKYLCPEIEMSTRGRSHLSGLFDIQL